MRKAVPEAHVLVADDNSPDGTGKLADELAAEDDQVQVLHRKGKEGLGAAYLAGFHWGMDNGYGVLDRDGRRRLPPARGTAPPAHRAQGRRPGARLPLGARRPGRELAAVPRGHLPRRQPLLPRSLLDLPLRDITGGYRAFRRETLEGLGLDEVASQGYCFQVDLARRAVKAGYHVVEVPITFVERELGDSKMSRDILVEALWRVTAWGVGERVGKITGRGSGQPERPQAPAPARSGAAQVRRARQRDHRGRQWRREARHRHHGAGGRRRLPGRGQVSQRGQVGLTARAARPHSDG